jgi:DNA repair exonuclease SbcCD ATPase subunit
MAEPSEAEKDALRVIQCSIRCAISRGRLRQLSSWFEEEQKWRQTLKRRRARIERLERELRHVENMPALDVDRYAATARYGMRGVEAAVQTIQGAWRSLVRARRRLRQRLERRNRAAAVLQRFFKKYEKLRRKTRCAAALSHPSCPACAACIC